MAGPGAIGLILDVNSGTPTTIGGKILNSGSIIATGEGAWGVEVETDTSPCVLKTVA